MSGTRIGARRDGTLIDREIVERDDIVAAEDELDTVFDRSMTTLAAQALMLTGAISDQEYKSYLEKYYKFLPGAGAGRRLRNHGDE